MKHIIIFLIVFLIVLKSFRVGRSADGDLVVAIFGVCYVRRAGKWYRTS